TGGSGSTPRSGAPGRPTPRRGPRTARPPGSCEPVAALGRDEPEAREQPLEARQGAGDPGVMAPAGEERDRKPRLPVVDLPRMYVEHAGLAPGPVLPEGPLGERVGELAEVPAAGRGDPDPHDDGGGERELEQRAGRPPQVIRLGRRAGVA